MSSSSFSVPIARNLILATLLVLAAAAWALLLWQSGRASEMDMGLTMGMSGVLFLAIWIVMMVAMMFPTAAPMILTFARIHESKRQREQPHVPTWVFVSAYLLVWTLFGALAYGIALGAERLAEEFPWVMENAGRIGGGVLVLAGIYQLSPLKNMCLSKCRGPFQFILTSWRDGYLGSFRMGLEHGMYCLGCCWLLFVILFPLGVMNVAAMAVITLLIFAEKSLPIGPHVTKVASLVLMVYGVAVLFSPSMPMPA